MSILPQVRLSRAIALPRPSAPARPHPATFSNIAKELRSIAASGRDIRLALFARAEDRSPPRANVARVSPDPYLRNRDLTPPSAIADRKTCGGTIPLRRSIPP